jgi:CMP-N,N'-diacetyllegionaminic acid synthase
VTGTNQPSVAALITARGGSKGIVGKNIYPLAGKPLIAHSILAAREATAVSNVYLSSDDAEIIAVAREYGCEVPFVRDAHLASDTATSIDVVLDALDRLPAHDIWVLLQPTSPLRTAHDIDSVIGIMTASGANSCVSVVETADHPWLVYKPADDGGLQPYCDIPGTASRRRQDLPRAYILNGAIYAFRPEWLMAEQKLVGDGTRFWPMPVERSVDIDEMDDVAAAEKSFPQTG